MNAGTYTAAPLWSLLWQAPPSRWLRHRLFAAVELCDVVEQDGTRLLRLSVELSVTGGPWFAGDPLYRRGSTCELHMSAEQVQGLHSALSRWLGVPMSDSRLFPARDGNGAAPRKWT